jgi:ABC-type transport system involved in multi-copper enzyme maturation permease subunit
MLSVLIKNIAVSIAVPAVCFIGCYLMMAALVRTRVIDLIAYTPVPYVQLSAFFTPYTYIYTASSAVQLMQRGMPLSVLYGIIMLLVLSALCVFVSIMAFRKRDITN